MSDSSRNYFWRATGDLNALKPDHITHHWHGPATVVNHHGAKVWIAYKDNVLLCSPEQLRKASEEEELAWEFVPEDLRSSYENLHGAAPTFEDLTQGGNPQVVPPHEVPPGAPEAPEQPALGDAPQDAPQPGNPPSSEEPVVSPEKSTRLLPETGEFEDLEAPLPKRVRTESQSLLPKDPPNPSSSSNAEAAQDSVRRNQTRTGCISLSDRARVAIAKIPCHVQNGTQDRNMGFSVMPSGAEHRRIRKNR
jgi:hypothetical protein